ncbi:MAG: DUF3347 domain-containing protein [Bacteroidia bacterium]
MKPKFAFILNGLFIVLSTQFASANSPDHRNIKSSVENTELKIVISSLQTNNLEKVYNQYFALKDALIQGDPDQAAQFARVLIVELDAVQTENTDPKRNALFITQHAEIKAAASAIAGAKKLSLQRTQFSALSDQMYALMKVFKPTYPVYLAHCPMFGDGNGANWISKENAIRNPYYGKRMMTCGKVKETLK